MIRQEGQLLYPDRDNGECAGQDPYLETLKDVSEVFRERQLGFLYRHRVTILMLVFGTVLMLVDFLPG